MVTKAEAPAGENKEILNLNKFGGLYGRFLYAGQSEPSQALSFIDPYKKIDALPPVTQRGNYDFTKDLSRNERIKAWKGSAPFSQKYTQWETDFRGKVNDPASGDRRKEAIQALFGVESGSVSSDDVQRIYNELAKGESRPTEYVEKMLIKFGSTGEISTERIDSLGDDVQWLAKQIFGKVTSEAVGHIFKLEAARSNNTLPSFKVSRLQPRPLTDEEGSILIKLSTGNPDAVYEKPKPERSRAAAPKATPPPQPASAPDATTGGATATPPPGPDAFTATSATTNTTDTPPAAAAALDAGSTTPDAPTSPSAVLKEEAEIPGLGKISEGTILVRADGKEFKIRNMQKYRDGKGASVNIDALDGSGTQGGDAKTMLTMRSGEWSIKPEITPPPALIRPFGRDTITEGNITYTVHDVDEPENKIILMPLKEGGALETRPYDETLQRLNNPSSGVKLIRSDSYPAPLDSREESDEDDQPTSEPPAPAAPEVLPAGTFDSDDETPAHTEPEPVRAPAEAIIPDKATLANFAANFRTAVDDLMDGRSTLRRLSRTRGFVVDKLRPKTIVH